MKIRTITEAEIKTTIINMEVDKGLVLQTNSMYIVKRKGDFISRNFSFFLLYFLTLIVCSNTLYNSREIVLRCAKMNLLSLNLYVYDMLDYEKEVALEMARN